MLKSDAKHPKSEIFSKQGAIKKLTDKYVFCWWPSTCLIRAPQHCLPLLLFAQITTWFVDSSKVPECWTSDPG